MDNSYIKNNLEQIFESFKEMIKVETVVGQAVHIGDAILVPFVDVTFGFGSGGVNGKTENGRSSAGSAPANFVGIFHRYSPFLLGNLLICGLFSRSLRAG